MTVTVSLRKKLNFMKTTLLLLTACAISGSLIAQTPVILQPGPGLNDYTDQGGSNGGKDLYSHEALPDSNNKASTAMVAAPVSNCNPTNSNDYIQFDLSGLPLVADSAFVGFTHLDHTTYCYSNCNADFYFAYNNDPWYEDSLTYNNAPSRGADFFGPVNITFPNSFGTREYNITAAYNAWQAGTVPNYGFVMYSPTVGCNNAAVMFLVYTSDDTIPANHPYLKVYGVPTQVKEHAGAMQAKVYPNPAGNTVNVELSGNENENVTVSIYDYTGRMVFSASRPNRNLRLDLENIGNGSYFISLKNNSGIKVLPLYVIR